jgi:hypothetical protein
LRSASRRNSKTIAGELPSAVPAADETPRRKRKTRLLRVLGGGVAVLVLVGLLGTGPDAPPPGETVVIKSFAKIYAVQSKTWFAAVDYASGLKNPPAVTRQAATLLGQLSPDLNALGVDRAILRVVETTTWFYLVTKRSPRVVFEAQRQPDGTWLLNE